MEIIIKKFKEWSFCKQNLHYSRKQGPLITEGEVWWCSFGVNVGSEIDGKNNLFTRPVVVFKKLSHDTFWGIPGTGQNKKGTWFVSVPFQERNQVFIVSEIRALSTKRLDKKMGMLSEESFKKIKTGFTNLFLEGLENINPSVFQEGTREIPESLPVVGSNTGSDFSITEGNDSSNTLGDNQNNDILPKS